MIDEIQSDVFTAIGKTKDILRCKNGNEYIKTLSPQAIQAIQEKGYNTRDLIANFSYTKQHILQTVKSLENLDKIKQAFIQQYIDWAEHGLSTIINTCYDLNIENILTHTTESIAQRDQWVADEDIKVKIYYDNLVRKFGFTKQQINTPEIKGVFWVKNLQ